MTDPVAIIKRVAASYGTDGPPPADLVRNVFDWLGSAAGPILAGTEPAEALGLRGRQGAWQNAPLQRAKLERRNELLSELWRLTAGSDNERARQVIAWCEDWAALGCERMAGPRAARLLDAIPPEAREPLDALADSGLPVPQWRQLVRVMRPASRGTGDAGNVPAARGPILDEAPPSRRVSNRSHADT